MEEKKSSKSTFPKEWKHTYRLSPLQRFKMYNPLKLDLYLKPSKNHQNIELDLGSSNQREITKLQVKKLHKEKREYKKMIENVVFKEYGSIKPSNDVEKTYHIKQKEIKNMVDLNTKKKLYSLNLEEYGPYHISYSKNGQYIILGGYKGHIALLRWKDFRLISEEYFNHDTIYDIKLCFNESMIATAQKEAVYIYNTKCVETHVLKNSMPFPLKLDYLPYHFILTSIGIKGNLVYFDVSTGSKVAIKHTNLGSCDVMTSNPKNSVIHLGHNNGVVTLWTPTNQKYVAAIKCHKSKLLDISIDNNGYHMATSDNNGYLKIWDLRKYKESIKSQKCNSAIKSVKYSQTNLLAYSTGRTVLIWNTHHSPNINTNPNNNNNNINNKYLYLKHQIDRELIYDLDFCPYEDILGIGTNKGFHSIIVPGSGEINYDILETDPFETKKKRNHKIVYQLLDKLRPDMIQLDPNFISNLPSKSLHIDHKRNRNNNDNDKKYARKNLTKSKSGYRGVIRRRYGKYRLMRDLYHREEQFKTQLNQNNKLSSTVNRLEQKQKKTKWINKMTNNNNNNNNNSNNGSNNNNNNNNNNVLKRFLQQDPKAEIQKSFRRKPIWSAQKKIHF